MNNLFDIVLVKVGKEDFCIKLLKVIMKDLITFPHSKVSISNQYNFMRVQTAEGMLHQTHDSRFRPEFQAPLPPASQVVCW